MFKPLVHKLLHAASVYPLGRQRLHYCLKALRDAKRDGCEHVFLSLKGQLELLWWQDVLRLGDQLGVPLASRYCFPAGSSADTLVYYGDASRELDDPSKVSGYGSWCVIEGTFYYFYGRWEEEELKRFSINVLEAKVRDDGLYRFARLALSKGIAITHVLAFTDNTAAEHTAERGRTGSDPMHELLQRRQDWLVEHGISAATERVTSADNDLADWLSRGDIAEVLRVVEAAGLHAQEVQLSRSERDTAWLPSSDLRVVV